MQEGNSGSNSDGEWSIEGSLVPDFNRRSFIKTSGAAVVAGGLLSGQAGGSEHGGSEEQPDESQNSRPDPTYIPLASGSNAGALYEPRPGNGNGGKKADIGCLVMHPDANFLDHPATAELSERGYHVLASTTRFTNIEGPTGGPYIFHELLEDVASAVRYLRDRSDIEKVVLVGHSGGCPLFSFYQNIAQNGFDACQGDEKIIECPDLSTDIPPADGLLILDGHPGYGLHGLTALDPSIVDEQNPRERDPDLDMFNPDNGYDPDGETRYSDDFLERFHEAQAERMNKLICRAQNRLEAIEAGNGDYPEDEPFIVPGMGARIYKVDRSLLARTRSEFPLITSEGTNTTVIESIYPSSGTPEDHRSYDSALKTSVRKFLNTHSIRTTDDYMTTEDSIDGVRYATSYTSAPTNLEGVTVPVLQLAMTAMYFVSTSETLYDHVASSDNELKYIEGATHGFTPISDEYGDTLQRTFDAADEWLEDRFVT